MNPDYPFSEIEKNTQAEWDDIQTFSVSENSNKPKFYALSMFPYPSGKLHMGHVRNYTIGDVISRFKGMNGFNVMQPMGWDAFGLPAENAAIQNNTAPAKWTNQNINHMREQLKLLGLAIDWKREISTCSVNYYKWEQWLFIKLYKQGLIYKKTSTVNWDPVDKTVLANEQVIDGKGWRSGAIVERKEIPQYFMKITDYADELLEGLDNLKDWPEQVKTMQKNWIGRSVGCDVDFKIIDSEENIRVYTTRPDTLMGATYLAIAAEHPLSKSLSGTKKIEDFISECSKGGVSEAEIATAEKKGIFTGVYVEHPLTNEKIPVWIANYVLINYGEGAVMAVPAHDERDYEFAKKYDLPINQVIKSETSKEHTLLKKELSRLKSELKTTAQRTAHENKIMGDIAKIEKKLYVFTGDGVLINSGEFNQLNSTEAQKHIIKRIESLNRGGEKIQYRLRDWGISRQRYWGCPIPMIYCKNCGDVPVAEKNLPINLPENVEIDNSGSPLKKMQDFIQCKCPECGMPAERETDTLDTFFESSWYFARYSSYDQENSMLDDRAKYWLPVDYYIGGVEHAILHLLYARFFNRILFDLGLINTKEPFKKLLTQGMVLKDGSKMSKSRGNTVDPNELIKKYGADTARVFIMFAAPAEQSLEWSDKGIEGAHRFLKRLWKITYQFLNPEATKANRSVLIDSKSESELKYKLNATIEKVTDDLDRRTSFNTAISSIMELVNLFTKKQTELNISTELKKVVINNILILLNPFAPHITKELWANINHGGNIDTQKWPEVDKSALIKNESIIVIQVNGKLRGNMVISKDKNEEEVKNMALINKEVKKFIPDNGEIKKIIYIKNKLINIVIK
jgi:leucyl-tRNA synthetase